LSDKNLFMLYMIITGIALFVIFYQKKKCSMNGRINR